MRRLISLSPTLSVNEMKTIIKQTVTLLITLIVCHCVGFAQTDSAQIKWSILPTNHLVPLFTADSRAHRLSLQKPFTDNGYIGSMGGIFPVVTVSKNNKAFQLSVASTVYTTLRKWTDRGRLLNIDFFVDFFGDVKLNEHWALRTSIGHTSQHLSDDAIIDEGKKPINYTRDYAQFFGDYQNPRYRFRVYGGLTYNGNFKTTKSYGVVLMPQIGFEHSPIKWLLHNYLYYAADIKFRGENNYKTIQNYQIGYKYSIEKIRAFRFALNYSRGLDERGQFYTQTRNFATLGIFFDF
jgi:hypothetical protein